MILILPKSLLKVKYLKFCKGGWFQNNRVIELKSPLSESSEKDGYSGAADIISFLGI
jgi:hypothetical protein